MLAIEPHISKENKVPRVEVSQNKTQMDSSSCPWELSPTSEFSLCKLNVDEISDNETTQSEN